MEAAAAPAQAAAAPAQARRAAGALALVALAACVVPLAAPGTGLVPGAAAGAPGWIRGVYGSGFGLDGASYRDWLWVALAAYAGVVVFADAIGPRTIRIAVLAGVVGFALAPPLLSLDVFSYISYARLGVLHGLNPYATAPAAIPHDAAAMRVEDFQGATSVYGPLFTLGSYPLGLIGVPAALWAMKALCAGAVLGIASLVGRLAERRGISPARAIAFVALNPLVLVQVVGGPHNDALMVLALCGGVLLLTEGRAAGAGGFFVAAIAVKASGAFAAPFALIGAGGQRLRTLGGAGTAALVLAAAGLAVFGTDVGHGLLVGPGGQTHTSYHSVPALLDRSLGLDLGVAKAVMLGLFGLLVAWLLIWTARGADWVTAAAWCGVGLLIASPYVTPWYVLWPLPLVAVSRDRRLVLVTLALCAYQLPAAIPA
ncbi:MAG: alpha,6-mannosyltransferase [Solirubrobacterales bacterium]|nr:alpha,6-mannosyltransferase [Solirubrobacterales bacterium]